MVSSLNLVNTAEWENIDILCITPDLLQFILSTKHEYDFYDINPEVIMIDDFDYLIDHYEEEKKGADGLKPSPPKNEKHHYHRYHKGVYTTSKNSITTNIAQDSTKSKSELQSQSQLKIKLTPKEIITQYFSDDKNLFLTETKRKLVLSSSSIFVDKLSPKEDFMKSFNKSCDDLKKFLIKIDRKFNRTDIVSTQHFMDIQYHLKDIKIVVRSFENEVKTRIDYKQELKSLLDKKFKYTLQVIADHVAGKIVICCKQQNMRYLKDHFKKKRVKFSSFDEGS